jgi:hypothetical protein
MRIAYRYCQPAPDPHGRSIFDLHIDGPQHPFILVVEESIEVPDGAGPERILETIYLRNESEHTPFRPRRLEVPSMFPGCLVHLTGEGWWLCEPVGFRPAPFEPRILHRKTLYRGEVVDDFPRVMRVEPTQLALGGVATDGSVFLIRRGVSPILDGKFGGARIEVQPAQPGGPWEVLAVRPARAGRPPRETMRTGSLHEALAVAARIASEAVNRPLAPARAIAAFTYRGKPRPPTEGVLDRLICPLYFDPVEDVVRAASDDRPVFRFQEDLQGTEHDPADPATPHIRVAARVDIDQHDRGRGLDHCKRQLTYAAGYRWLAASPDPLPCGLLSADMSMHALPGPGEARS